jgi:hypothetical protein
MNTTNIAIYFTANEMTAKSNFPPNTITFSNANTWVMRITADRRIEVNEDVAVSEAAQAIFDALERYWQKKPWVGLTDEEVGDLSDFAYDSDEEFVRNVEAKLRDKNGG